MRLARFRPCRFHGGVVDIGIGECPFGFAMVLWPCYIRSHLKVPWKWEFLTWTVIHCHGGVKILAIKDLTPNSKKVINIFNGFVARTSGIRTDNPSKCESSNKFVDNYRIHLQLTFMTEVYTCFSLAFVMVPKTCCKKVTQLQYSHHAKSNKKTGNSPNQCHNHRTGKVAPFFINDRIFWVQSYREGWTGSNWKCQRSYCSHSLIDNLPSSCSITFVVVNYFVGEFISNIRMTWFLALLALELDFLNPDRTMPLL